MLCRAGTDAGPTLHMSYVICVDYCTIFFEFLHHINIDFSDYSYHLLVCGVTVYQCHAIFLEFIYIISVLIYMICYTIF